MDEVSDAMKCLIDKRPNGSKCLIYKMPNLQNA